MRFMKWKIRIYILRPGLETFSKYRSQRQFARLWYDQKTHNSQIASGWTIENKWYTAWVDVFWNGNPKNQIFGEFTFQESRLLLVLPHVTPRSQVPMCRRQSTDVPCPGAPNVLPKTEAMLLEIWGGGLTGYSFHCRCRSKGSSMMQLETFQKRIGFHRASGFAFWGGNSRTASLGIVEMLGRSWKLFGQCIVDTTHHTLSSRTTQHTLTARSRSSCLAMKAEGKKEEFSSLELRICDWIVWFGRGLVLRLQDQLRCKPPIQLDGVQLAQPQPDETDLQRAAMHMSNYKGHSYVTRHMVFGLPHWCYKSHPWVVDKHMVLLSADLGQCFRQGIDINGKQFFAAVIGSKGDMKHQMEFGNLTRSYHTFARGKQQTAYMCSLCYAGARGVPLEDTQDEPTWATTLYAARPWNSTPNILLHLPHNRNEAEEFFQLDTFHLVKVGLGRDLCGSGILVLARLGLYDWEGCTSKTLSDRLQRAHQSFSLWCAGCKCKPGLRSFTKQFLNIQSKKSFAWMNTKGSDTMMVIRYLKWFAGIELIAPSTKKAEENQKILRLLKHTTDNLLQAFSIIHGHGLWLDRPCGKLLYTCFMVTLRGYKSLAKHALQLQLCGFAFKPKFHGLHHVAYKLRLDLLAGNQRVLNPVCWMCEQDEDKVGKISRLSRRISVRNQTSQILYRYMLKKKSCLARSKEECKHRKWQNTSRSWAGVMESHLASKVALGMPRS